MPTDLPDTQSLADRRNVPLERVGIKGIQLPFLIKEMTGGHQTALATVTFTAGLPHYFKGTHMSRFVAILEDWRNRPIAGREIKMMLEQIMERLNAETAHIEIWFKYFIEKHAPVSDLQSILGYECCFYGDLNAVGFEFRLGVEVPVNTVCPCSKQISVIGAHNQRAIIRSTVKFIPGQFLWIEELVGMLEKQGSTEIYPLLKREDEKYVTEYSFGNPKFVEDVVRDCVLALRRLNQLRWFEVECEAQESIHAHNAFAYQQESVSQVAE